MAKLTQEELDEAFRQAMKDSSWVPQEVVVERLSELETQQKELDEAQDNATDIYKIAARVKNLARGNDASLTKAGEALCNLYVHVLEPLYKFSETLESPKKEQLYDMLRIAEEMPRNLILAMKPKKTHE